MTQGPGTNNPTLDFGFHLKLEIGDRLWFDDNFNGLQQVTGGNPLLPVAPENPGGTIAGATINVELYNGATAITTATDANGFYLFERRVNPTFIQPGTTYRVRVRLTSAPALSGYQPTDAAVGNNRQLDNDGKFVGSVRTLVQTDEFTTMNLGTSDLQYDFGFVPIFRIGDYVWYDSNANGNQDEVQGMAGPGTGSLAGVNVELRTFAGDTLIGVAATQTNAAGRYEFDSLSLPLTRNTRYRIAVPMNTPGDATRNPALAARAYPLLPLVPTRPNAVGDNIDSDGLFDRSSALAPRSDFDNALTGNYGTNIQDYDFGFTDPLAIGDFIWVDSDEDGIQDAGETGLSGVTVVLCNGACPSAVAAPLCTGTNRIAEMTTGSDGLYLFTEADVGYGDRIVTGQAFCVMIDRTQPALTNTGNTFNPSQLNAGTNDELDSDADPTDVSREQ